MVLFANTIQRAYNICNTCNEIVNVWINVNHNYLLNIQLSLIVMSIPPISTLSKEIRKTMNKMKMTWKLLKKFEMQTFSIRILQYQKRGITLEPLCRTSQNKCHPHLPFIDSMYSNFRLDVFTTVVYKSSSTENSNVKTICHLFSRCRCGTESGLSKHNITEHTMQNTKWWSLYTMHSSLYMLYNVHTLYMIDFKKLGYF